MDKFVHVDSLKIPLGPKDTRLILALEYIKDPQWEKVLLLIV